MVLCEERSRVDDGERFWGNIPSKSRKRPTSLKKWGPEATYLIIHEWMANECHFLQCKYSAFSTPDDCSSHYRNCRHKLLQHHALLPQVRYWSTHVQTPRCTIVMSRAPRFGKYCRVSLAWMDLLIGSPFSETKSFAALYFVLVGVGFLGDRPWHGINQIITSCWISFYSKLLTMAP